MKKTNDNSQALALMVSLTLGASSFAGTTVTTGKTPLAPPPPPAGLYDDVGATVDIGYDTHYFFRGFLLSEQNIWAQASWSVPLTTDLSLGVAAWYSSSTDNDYNELDLSVGLTYDADFVRVGFGYTHYEFFDGRFGNGVGFDSTDELGLTLSKTVGLVNLSAAYYYDFRADGSYIETGIDAPIAITDNFSIVPSALISYGVNYYSNETGFQNIRLGLAFPIKLTAKAVLTPYVAGNIALDTTDAFTDDEIYGGVKLSISF